MGIPVRVAAALWLAIALGAATRASGETLDPFDTTPRPIQVELENSTNLDVVGVAFGAPVAASYAVSGGVGTITIPIASHEQMRSGGLPPVPGTFTPLVIEIDLVDLSASSQGASGTLGSGGLVQSFTLHPLGSDTLAGHFSNQSTPFHCTSQAEVDAACQAIPSLCGQTCVIVPGAAYDPVTGKANLVGSETVQGCDGSFCMGPFVFFSQHGDLRFTEAPAPVVPALGASSSVLLAACLLLAGCAYGRRNMRHTAGLLAAVALFVSAPAEAEPLDVFDATARQIEVELENSASPGVVGVSYAAPVLASYSASGGTGTIVIPIPSHQQMRAVPGFTPIPNTFTTVVISIDLSDLGATSQTASGALQNPPFAQGFTQQPLGTDTAAGYFTVEGVTLFCASQQQVDDQCAINPLFCGLTCNLVPGAPYDPVTGKVNMVGADVVQGCDGAVCFGPFTHFSKHGDLRLSESDAPVVPALPPPAQIGLGAGLLLGGCAALAARRRRGGA